MELVLDGEDTQWDNFVNISPFIEVIADSCKSLKTLGLTHVKLMDNGHNGYTNAVQKLFNQLTNLRFFNWFHHLKVLNLKCFYTRTQSLRRTACNYVELEKLEALQLKGGRITFSTFSVQ